jgi:hypothetical protein
VYPLAILLLLVVFSPITFILGALWAPLGWLVTIVVASLAMYAVATSSR